MSKTRTASKAKDTAPSEPNKDSDESLNHTEDDIFQKPEDALPIGKNDMVLGKIVKYELLKLEPTKDGINLNVRHYEGVSENKELKFGIGGKNQDEILAVLQSNGYVIAAEQSPTEQKQIIIFLPYQDGSEDIYWLFQKPY